MVMLHKYDISVVSVEAIMRGERNNPYKDATIKKPLANELPAYFYTLINNAVLTLVRSLPQSVQTYAMMFFLNHAGIEPGQPLDFFRNYYSPVWSCIPHIINKVINECAIVTDEFVNHAATAHAMIMLMHSLDDHIHDGQIKPDHVILLIRSQMWKLIWEALSIACSDIPDGMNTVNTCINRYYAAIMRDEGIVNLEEYLAIFKDQMATGLIVPLLTAQLTGDISLQKGVRASFEHFGVAWRILDDIHDLEDDLNTGRITAVTLSLTREIKRSWAETAKKGNNAVQRYNIGSKKHNIFRKLSVKIHDSGIVNNLVKRIIIELEAAAQYALESGLYGLAKEIRDLPDVWHINFSGIKNL